MSIYNEEYKKSMKMIEDFFYGKSDAVKTALKAEINTCIETQNFERAAKLRDIYKQLDLFTQKQTVIIDQRLNGVVAKIVLIESKRIYVVIVFQEGKMIDILRFSESSDEIDQGQIISSIELEFGALDKLKEPASQELILYSTGLKIKQSTRKELELHFSNFITSFIASSSRQKDSIANDVLKGLQQRYGLAFYPYRMECLDISHLSGGWASGGLSCMVGTMSEKRGYRRYKIKTAKGGDDYDSLRECIIRRFKGETKRFIKSVALGLKDEKAKELIGNKELEVLQDEALGVEDGIDNNSELRTPNSELFIPDLFILDGAEKQLDVVKKLFEELKLDPALLDHVQFVSLGKGAARKSRSKIYGEKEKLYVLTKSMTVESFDLVYDEIDKLLIRIRDESHRFANSYRKKQMSMEIRKK